MTLDTATLRAQWEAIREQQGPAAFAMITHVGDGIALLDALDAERGRVRVLREALHDALRSMPAGGVPIEAYRSWMAALATAGGEGATT